MLVRFTPSEFELVKFRARSSRRTMARYVRERALGAEPHASPTRDVDAVLYHLGRIGNNVNQLAHVANATDRFPSEERLNVVLAELRALIGQLAGKGTGA
jgi:hypothetical protein